MAVITVVEDHELSEANFQMEGGNSYTRVFKVFTDDKTDRENTIRTATDPDTGLSIPEFGDPHPAEENSSSGNAASCKGIKIVRLERDQCAWHVTCTYDNQGQSYSAAAGENLADTPATIRFAIKTYEEVAEFAYQGGDTQFNPTRDVANSAGFHFIDKPVMVEKGRLMFLISYYIEDKDFDPSWLYFYAKTVNSSLFTLCGLAIGEHDARINEFSADPVYDNNGNLFWKMSFEIEHRHEGWRAYALDIGTQVKGADNKPKPILGEDRKTPVTSPVALSGGVPKADPTDYEYISPPFPLYWEADWSVLGLPEERS